MSSPLFSVVIPVYNGAGLVEKALDCIIAQTEPDWEAIVVDDGSKDDTLKIIKRYAQADNRIRVIHQENRGVMHAWDHGNRESRGQWLCNLAADDLYDRRKFEIHRAWFAKHPTCKFFYTHFWFMHETSGELIDTPYLAPIPDQPWQIIQSFGSNLVHANSTMVARDALDQVGGLDKGCVYNADYDLWLRLLGRFPAVFIPERTCVTRLHPDSFGTVNKIACVFDAARSGIRFLNEYTFAQIFHLLDLNNVQHAYVATEQTLRIAAHPSAFLNQLGPHPALILRLLEWAWAPERSPQVAASVRPLIRRHALDSANALADTCFGPLWRAVAVACHQPQPTFRYSPLDPFAEVGEPTFWRLGSSSPDLSKALQVFFKKVTGRHPDAPKPLPPDDVNHLVLDATDDSIRQAEARVRAGRTTVLLSARPADSALFQEKGVVRVSAPSRLNAAHTLADWARFQPSGRRRTPPYVHIGIVTSNRIDCTRKMLQALAAHTTFPYILSVVDNASTDGTREYLKRLNDECIINNLLLLNRNVGLACGSNLAWLQDREAPYYLRLDNDVVIQKDNWLERMVQTIDALPELGAVAYNFESTSYPLSEIRGVGIRLKSEGHISGACYLIPARTSARIGRWCEADGLSGFEDADYNLRINLIGQKCAYMPEEKIGRQLLEQNSSKAKYDNVGAVGGRFKGYTDGTVSLTSNSVFETLPVNPSPDSVELCLPRMPVEIEESRHDDPARWHESALQMAEAGKLDCACNSLHALVAKYPTYYVALNDLGVLYFQSGDLEKAQNYFEQSARMTPDHANTLKNLAAVHAALGRNAEAIAIYGRIMELTPDDDETLALLNGLKEKSTAAV